MTEQIIRKFNRRIHLLNFLRPINLSQETIAMLAIADLGRSADAFIERLRGLE